MDEWLHALLASALRGKHNPMAYVYREKDRPVVTNIPRKGIAPFMRLEQPTDSVV